MTLTLKLPEDLETHLRREAKARHVPIEKIALELLEEALYPTPEQVVGRIKGLPPEPQYVVAPTGSLTEVLKDAPPEPTDFDLVEWGREWADAEMEIKRITRENDIAEGRS